MHLPSIYYFRQVFIVTGVYLSSLGLGLDIAWSSPMFFKLMNEDTQFPRRISEEDGTWIVSIGLLAPIFLSPTFPWLVNRLGRKRMLILSAILKAGLIIFLVFANKYWMLYVVRAMMGVCDSFLVNNMAAYSAEIASKEIRGALGTMGIMSLAIGMLIMFSVGPYTTYLVTNIVFATIVVLAAMPLFFITESPCCLLRKGKTNEALQTLIYLRGSESQANEEITGMNEELHNTSQSPALFRDLVFLKCLAIGILLCIGVQTNGYLNIVMYLQTILDKSGSSISSNLMSVIFGVMQLVAGIFTVFFSDKAGRKPILCVTLVGIALGMAGLGHFFTVAETDTEIKGVMNYLPLICLIIIVTCHNAGPGSLTLLLCAELLENRARSLGISISLSIGFATSFINIKYFPQIMHLIGPANVFWTFSMICLALGTFILFFVPETKQRSFLEIQRAMGTKTEFKHDGITE